MATNSFSVNSLLNNTPPDEDIRLSPTSSITDSSASTGNNSSSVGSPLAGTIQNGTTLPSLAASPANTRAWQPASSNPSVSAARASNRHFDAQSPMRATQPLLPPPPPLHTASIHHQHYRQSDYVRQHVYRHQRRIPLDASHSQHRPPVSTTEMHTNGGDQWQRTPHNAANHGLALRHQIPTAEYRYWPYPPPPQQQQQHAFPPYLAPGGGAGPYYAHPGGTPLPPPPPPVPAPHSGSAGMHVPWRRERRSKACLRCHTKKIKCEGTGPICDGCRHAGCECKWVEMKKRGPKPKKSRDKVCAPVSETANVQYLTPKPSSGALAEAAVPASAAASAISSEQRQQQQQKISGVMRAETPPIGQTAAPSPPEALSPESATMDQVMQRFHSDHVPADTREAVVYYFDYIYARTPIFHPATFVRRVAFGQVDPLLIDAIKACTARIITKRTGRAIDIGALNTSIRKRLLGGQDQPTLDYVRAILLAAIVSGSESKLSTYGSLAGLASSIVMRLEWHMLDLGRGLDEIPWEEWVTIEEKRRTFWAVYQLDSYYSLLSDRPMNIDRMHVCISTPGSDYTWDDISMPQIMHWPTRHQSDIRRDVVIRMGALSYTFMDLCSLTTIISQINEFLWDVRVRVLATPLDGGWSAGIPFMEDIAVPELGAPQEPVASMFEYPEFCEFHKMLHEWRTSLIPSEDITNSQCSPMSDVGQVGSLENRRFMMRVRYFSLRCYVVPFILLLHFTNRPSFFNHNHQLPKRIGKLVGLVSATDSQEDRVLRSMMSMSFSEIQNDGFLAYDIVDESWDICLSETYLLVEHLERNSDIPIDRYDNTFPFCIFTPITVLVRHIRICREKTHRYSTVVSGSSAALRNELAKAVSALRRLWNLLKELGFLWGAGDMEKLLRTMQVEEIVNATDLLQDLNL
ncbi:hypothetical protein H4R20_001786 [Coemansia guatemalensis]|uniref:Zn(2)-C6 fungal-type domain-containing protein n=1 Tax=Coemansia guatemalensis TaxID=2761395 RepID=A0A9W8LVC0_9FUNG|nr:hypothetical protein H4R20_001786 [Coemansia guatemalensis]